jgi:hypothetical protein
MDLAVIIAAAAEHAGAAAEHAKQHRSEVPFFIAGGAFATFAVLVSVYGFKRPEFPATVAAARAVMSVGAVLMLTAVGVAVYVAL